MWSLRDNTGKPIATLTPRLAKILLDNSFGYYRMVRKNFDSPHHGKKTVEVYEFISDDVTLNVGDISIYIDSGYYIKPPTV